MTTLLDELESHQKNKKDKRVFGLVLPGGGMRGVYSAGAVSTLITYGLGDAFEHIIGASAGAIHGAYLLANDNTTMRHTYSKDLTNKNFINLLRRDKKIDVDYLIDSVLKQKHPLNLNALRNSKTKLHVILTRASSGKKVVLSNHHEFAEIYEELRASAALPLLYDKKILVNGDYYIDGSVSDSLPIDVAIDLQCTDIVVIMTQKLENYHFDRKHQRLVRHLLKRFAKNHTAGVRKQLPTNQRMLQINIRRLLHPTKKIRFYVVEPSDEAYMIGMATIDKEKVQLLATMGMKDMDTFLQKSLVSV